MTEKAITVEDTQAARFGKLLPSEVTALYLSLRPFVAGGDPKIHLAVALICLILAILFIRTARGVTSWGHTLIYAITFLVWVLTLEPSGVEFWMTGQWKIGQFTAAQYATIGAITSILWTFVITNLIPVNFVSSPPTPVPAH